MSELIIRFWQGLQFYWGDISYLTVQHLQIVAISGMLALAIALPLGVWMSRPANQRYAMASMQVLNVGQAIPKLALLALAMSLIGVGSGAAIIGLFVATLLPVAVNTYEGLRAVPQHLVEAAEAMGMTRRETLWKVEIPNALNVIFAGIRTALAINVGTAPLAFLVGGGGLGELIFTGIDLNDFGMMLAGAISTALLAIAVDLGCGLIQHVAVSRGLRMAGRQ
ncbi:binding-protein-dependent transport systems inner membrane component [Pseudomonas fluorescens]|uniref:Binding-protein-dependent transport systems inner membrane component n=1 Tax=Pseudomonas fluorescens TaxID=294 RepID=A0A3S4SWA7_PSEFL|nr:ABC transporter permease [Pseudomonas fluorescens]VEF08271.1 binding-protein-dependent transport systems inner membrane component [Pseudomonas fluorescens]